MKPARAAAALERGTARLGMAAYRRPVATLALLAALTGLGVLSARTLVVDTDLVGLLPQHYQSVQDLAQLETRFGSVGYVIVAGLGADPDARRRFAEDLAPRLEALETVRYVQHRRPTEFFADRALYFLDTADLTTLRERLAAREAWERRRRNPMYVDLEEDDAAPPPLDFSDLRARYEDRLGQRFASDGGAPDPYYDDPRQGLIAVFARPTRRATDLDYVKRLIAEVEAVVADIDPARYGEDFRVALTGLFKKRLDQQQQVTGDLGRATGLALLLVLAYLAFHFRALRAVLLVVGPLVIGLAWTFGLAAALFGTLNLITGFIGAILLGLGVDHGIHLLGRYHAERGAGAPPEAAVAAMFGDTGRAVVIAALTTIGAFAGVALSEFRAFREFGVIAAAGLALVVLAYTLALPALLALGSRYAARGARPARPSPFLRWLAPRAWKVAAVAGLLAVVGLSRLPDLRFNADFESLEDNRLTSSVLDDKVGRLMGYSRSPSLVLTESAAEEAAAVAALRRVKAARGEGSTIDFAVSLADLVPADQDAKRAEIEQIGRILRRVNPESLEDEAQRAQLKQARRMTEAAPFGRADLPAQVRQLFTGPNAGPEEGFVLVFPSISTADGLAVRDMKAELLEADLLPHKRLPIAAESLITADILDMLVQESRPILGVTLIFVLACLWLLLGRLADALRCFLAAAVSLLVALALLPVLDLRLNYLNVVVVPVLFGIAVDGAVHLTVRARASGAGLDEIRALGETLRGIAGAVTTTALGFGTLALVDHPGLESIGQVALVGLAVNLLVSLVAFPAVQLALRPARERKRAPVNV